MPSAQSYDEDASTVVCETESPALVPMYAMSPAAILFFAFGMVAQGEVKLPDAESLPFAVTKKMPPARTVNGSALLAPFEATCTTMSPVFAAAPSWKVTLVSVQIG
jgi:hypothetical protein